MPFVAAPNIIMLEFRYTMSGQNTENRVMIDNLAAVNATALQDVADAGLLWVGNTYLSNVGQNVTLREVVATDMSVQNGEQVTVIPGSTVTGSKPAPLPNESAFCISLRSGSRGRSARGRWFAGSLSGNDRADSNTLTAGYVTDFTTALNALIGAIDALGKKLVIVSYRSNNAPRPGGPVYFVVTVATAVDAVIDSQRKRKPGVGS